MPLGTIPAVDAQICSGWSPQQTNLYNNLSYFLAKLQVDKRKTFPTHSKMVGKIPWKANEGLIMRGIRKEPSPNLRQFAFPAKLTGTPRKDVVDVREMKVEVEVSRHRFESPVMNYLPDFRDFMTDHVKAHGEDIEEKKIRYEDLFVRGNIFHQSPYVWLADRVGGSLVAAPMGDGNVAGTTGKTTAWLAAQLPQLGNPGGLTLNTINAALTAMEVDLRVLPYQGGGQVAENGPLADKFCLIHNTESWNQFIYDPFLLANKSIDLNIITEGFRGSLFGRVVSKLEDLPLYLKADGTFPAPEVREVNPDAYNFGESLPNSVYTDIATSPYGVAFLYGREGYKSLSVGPPPKAFAGNGMPDGFGKMFWNGEIMITKNIILPCVDENDSNVITYEANVYGEYLKFISQITLGLLGQQKRNVLPIIYKRQRGA